MRPVSADLLERPAVTYSSEGHTWNCVLAQRLAAGEAPEAAGSKAGEDADAAALAGACALEAAACGRPLIASDVPGCREIARNNVNALLVPPDDPDALAQAIAIMMNDRDMRARFGNASREIVTREFSSTRIGNEIIALYAHLLAHVALPDNPAAARVVR